MKRTLKLALTAVLGAALVVPALAQDNFPDVPDNHWAYEALLRLKSNGLLVGYPDGLIRGGRPASRYEMAVAIHATYVNLKNITDGLQKQIDELKGQIGSGGNTGDLQATKAALENLQNEVAGIKKWGDDIASLRKLVDTFQKELQDLNVNVEQVKKDLGDLTARVETLEKIKPAIAISGDANLFVLTGGGTDGFAGLSKDGRFVGSRFQNAPANVTGTSFLKDLSVFHEGALTFTSTKETGPKFAGTVVFSNLIGPSTNPNVNSFGSQTALSYGQAYGEGNATDVYIQNFGVKFDSAFLGQPLTAEVGRLGYKLSPYILQRQDTTSYYSNERWDNGEYMVDGAKIGLNFGKAKLEVVGGKTNRRFSNNGTDVQMLTAGGLGIDQTLGLNLGFGFGESGNVNVSYLLLDSTSATGVIQGKNFQRIGVFGADGSIKFGDIKLMAGYAQSTYQNNSKNAFDKDNKAIYAGAGYDGNNWGVSATYRDVDAFYAAPGDWGRLGIWRNPTNIQGAIVKGHLNLGDKLTVHAGGEFEKGKKTIAGSPLNKNTEITSLNLSVDYKLASNFSLMVGYEETEFKKLAGNNTKPKYRFTTLGVGYNLSDTTMLKIGYELSDVKNEFVLPLLGTARNNAGTYRGGLFTTQLSVKF
jgi:hypothetical protein